MSSINNTASLAPGTATSQFGFTALGLENCAFGMAVALCSRPCEWAEVSHVKAVMEVN